MPDQSEFFDRAAECERLMNVAADSIMRETFKQLRDMWIALANESATIPADDVTRKIVDIEKLQLGLSE
jgi:hypothetical protein